MRNNSTWSPSALSPTSWPREAWNPILTIVTVVGVVAILLVTQSAFGLFAIFVAHTLTIREAANPATIPPVQALLLQFVSVTPVIGFLLLILPPLTRTSLHDLGFRAPTGRELAIAALGAVGMAIAVDGSANVLAALTHRHDTEQAVALLKSLKTVAQQIMFFFLACVFAPLSEELVFRVFLFGAMTRWSSGTAYLIIFGGGVFALVSALVHHGDLAIIYGLPIVAFGFVAALVSRWVPVAAAALISAACFGLLHVSNFPGEVLTVGLPLALGGLVLTYVYASTRCFWSNVLSHAIFNTLGVASFFFFHAS